jgi:hypothetical protein
MLPGHGVSIQCPRLINKISELYLQTSATIKASFSSLFRLEVLSVLKISDETAAGLAPGGHDLLFDSFEEVECGDR